MLLNSTPIMKYTIGKNDAKWQSAQDHLATLSTNSVHRVAEATTHESRIDDEADSAAASAAIHDVVTSVRKSQALASADRGDTGTRLLGHAQTAVGMMQRPARLRAERSRQPLSWRTARRAGS